LWRSAYTVTEGVDGTLSIDGSQSPRYGGLNIIPQPSGLHEEVDGFVELWKKGYFLDGMAAACYFGCSDTAY